MPNKEQNHCYPENDELVPNRPSQFPVGTSGQMIVSRTMQRYKGDGAKTVIIVQQGLISDGGWKRP